MTAALAAIHSPVRPATAADMDAVCLLCQASGFWYMPEDMESSAPWWCVYEQDGEIIGALQFCIGRPIARLEELAMEPTLRKRDKAMVAEALIRRGMALCRAAGAGMVQFFVPEHLGSYRRVLEKRGAVSVGEGRMLVKRLV